MQHFLDKFWARRVWCSIKPGFEPDCGPNSNSNHCFLNLVISYVAKPEKPIEQFLFYFGQGFVQSMRRIGRFGGWWMHHRVQTAFSNQKKWFWLRTTSKWLCGVCSETTTRRRVGPGYKELFHMLPCQSKTSNSMSRAIWSSTQWEYCSATRAG